MKKVLRIFAIILAIVAILMMAIPAYAIPLPDSTPALQSVDIFRNLLETGDMLIIFYLNIPYASTPTTPVTQAFILRLIDTDGTTELGSTTGSVYVNNGYGYNVWSLYFAAASAPAWGGLYTLRLTGNPTAFTTPPEYNYPLNATYYTSVTTQADNQAALTLRVIQIATDLNTKWALGAAYYLTEQGSAGTVLSIYGQAAMNGCIYGLQGMAPTAYAYVVNDINAPDRTWSDNYSSNLTSQWTGTWVETVRQAGISFWGTGWDLSNALVVVGLVVGMILANLMLSGDIWNALIDVAFILVITARLGMLNLLSLGFIEAMCLVYLSFNIWHPTRG